MKESPTSLGFPKPLISQVEGRQNAQPFILRAHHAIIITDMFFNRTSVEEMVIDIISSVTKSKRQGYANDVLGNTPEELERYKRNATEFLEEFMQLPPDYPVKITEDQKDKLCEGCAIGKHCAKPVKRSIWHRDADILNMDNVIKVAKQFGLENELTIVRDVATYSNSKPKKTRYIITSAKVAKKILYHYSFLIVHTGLV